MPADGRRRNRLSTAPTLQARVAMGLIIAAMVLAIWLLPQLAGTIVVVLLPDGFIVSAADERKRARRCAPGA